MYQALYRKWRPKTFDDVVGQEPITTTLKNQVATGQLSHAYLFCGSRGTGKTSCAKILAKAVNCLNPQQGNPCGQCEICIGIEQESILDISEIDAASNRGIDDIRALREEANFTPVSTAYRVYIVDEVHMLTDPAFNALLKIMEEPPPHVLFVLATTEIHKVPATILSRCQRFDFQRIAASTIAELLLDIAAKEDIVLSQDAALLIGRLADGAVRDALSLLDLCVTSGEDITVELVESRAGLASQEYLVEIAKAAATEDGAKALQVLAGLWQYSVDYQRFCEQLLGFYRNLLIVKSVTDPSELVAGTTLKELEILQQVADSYTLAGIFYSITVLSDTLQRMSRTPMRRTEMEMGLLKLCNPAMDTSPDALLARIEKLEHAPKITPKQLQQMTAAVTETVSEASTTTPSTAEGLSTDKPSVKEETAPTSKPESTASSDPAADSRFPVTPFRGWSQVLTILKTQNKALFGSLVDSKAYSGGDLLLVDAGNELFAEIIRSDDYARESLRAAAETVTGSVYRLGPYNSDDFVVVDADGTVGEQPALTQQETEENSVEENLDILAKAAEDLGISVDIIE